MGLVLYPELAESYRGDNLLSSEGPPQTDPTLSEIHSENILVEERQSQKTELYSLILGGLTAAATLLLLY